MRIVLGVLLTSLISLQIQAAPPKFVRANYKWMTPSEYKENRTKAQSRSGERKIANTISEEMMSIEYRAFRDKFLKVKTSQDYAKLLDELEKGYDSHPADLKYVAARMKPVNSMRGILFRLTKIMKKEDVTHSYFLTIVRRLAGQMRIFFPFDHADATFDYFARPYKEGRDIVDYFDSIEDFQSYMVTDVYKLLIESANRIQSMDFSKTRILWDNKILNGSESFVDDVARYRVIGEAERYASMYRLHRGMAFVNRFASYNNNKVLEYTKDMGKLYGIDGFFSSVDGAPSYKRVKIAEKKKYENLFKLTESGGDFMGQSLKHIQESVKFLRIIHDELKNRPANTFQRINPVRVTAWEREINSGLDTIEAIVSGPTELRSAITGEVIQVNFPEFYLNPPKDLKKLLPIDWDIENKKVSSGLKRFQMNKNKREFLDIKYRNYHWGSPTKWNGKGYKRYFPSIKDDSDIPRHIRIFRQSLGASTVGTVITQFTE